MEYKTKFQLVSENKVVIFPLSKLTDKLKSIEKTPQKFRGPQVKNGWVKALQQNILWRYINAQAVIQGKGYHLLLGVCQALNENVRVISSHSGKNVLAIKGIILGEKTRMCAWWLYNINIQLKFFSPHVILPFSPTYIIYMGQDRVVGIATSYGLGGPGIESRREARFCVPVKTYAGAQPASYTMGTGSFPRVKRLGRGVGHPSLSSIEVKEKVQLYLYSPSGPSWPVLGWTLLIYNVTFREIINAYMNNLFHNQQKNIFFFTEGGRGWY
jgi:hypothetical protein